MKSKNKIIRLLLTLSTVMYTSLLIATSSITLLLIPIVVALVAVAFGLPAYTIIKYKKHSLDNKKEPSITEEIEKDKNEVKTKEIEKKEVKETTYQMDTIPRIVDAYPKIKQLKRGYRN